MTINSGEVLLGICAHESERTIAKTIESVQKQLYTNWKMLIIVSKSLDNTLNICREFGDSRIQIVEKSTVQTWAESSIEILDQCESEYFMWLDADDSITEDWLEKNIRNIKVEDSDSSFGQILLSNDGGKTFLNNISNCRSFGFASRKNSSVRVLAYVLLPESYGAVNLLYSVWKTKSLRRSVNWDKYEASLDFDTGFILNSLSTCSFSISDETFIIRENRSFNNLPLHRDRRSLLVRSRLSELRAFLWQLLVTKPRARRYFWITVTKFPCRLSLVVVPALFLRLALSAGSKLLISVKLRVQAKL